MNVVKCGHCDGLVDRTMHHSDVVEFMRKFGMDYNGPPRPLPEDVREFREKKLKEELAEYLTAKNLREKFDGALDLLYLLYGDLHIMGMPVNKGWERVHRANMAKELPTDVEKTKHKHKHCLIKPDGWRAPSFDDIVPAIDIEVVIMEEQVDPPLCTSCHGEAERIIGDQVIPCEDCDGTGFEQQSTAQPNATTQTDNP